MHRATAKDFLDRVDAAAAGDVVDPLEVQLRDGSRALLRPVGPADKERLARGLERLSAESRHLRFGTDIQHLTDKQLRYFTELDYDDHVAWGALDPEDAEHPGMGVARWIRLREDPEVAEVAIVVADDYQGRGLGTILLAALLHTARARGIRVFRNYVLEQNDEMLSLLGQLGAISNPIGGGMYEVDMPIPDTDDALPDTPAGRVLRSFAERLSWPWRLGRFLQPVWGGGGEFDPPPPGGDLAESQAWIDEYLMDLDKRLG